MSVIYKYLHELRRKQQNSQSKEKAVPEIGKSHPPPKRRGSILFLICCLCFILVGGGAFFLIKHRHVFSYPRKSPEPPHGITSTALIQRLESAMNPDAHSVKSTITETGNSLLSKRKKQYSIFIENIKHEANKRLRETLRLHSKRFSSNIHKRTKRYVPQKETSLERQFQRHVISLSRKNEEISHLQRTLQALVTDKNLEQAGQVLAKLESIVGKQSPLVLKWMGVILLQKGNFKKAERIFLRVISMCPDDTGSYVNLILTLLREKKYDEARRYYEIFQDRFPDSVFLSRLAPLFG